MNNMLKAFKLCLTAACIFLGTTIVQGAPVATPAGGYNITWSSFGGSLNSPTDAALASNGSFAFGSGQLLADGGIHDIDNVIDGFYGNSSSWIDGGVFNTGEATRYIGVRLPQQFALSTLTWGRDNLGTFTDRSSGTYTIQVTTDNNVGRYSAWTSIGTVDLNSPADTNDALRNVYSISTSGALPINATGLRILPPSGADIDEIELYGTNLGGPPTVASHAFVTTQSSGYTITWNGNDGANSSNTNAATVPNNQALPVNGGTAFSDGQFGNPHLTTNLNDGQYGNIHSWISDGDATSFAGITLAGLTNVTSIAFGRDNGLDAANGDTNINGGQLTDRALGVYTLQYTLDFYPNALTPDADWITIGSLNYTIDEDTIVGGGFTSYLRHEFGLLMGGQPIPMRGFRILEPNGNAIDEIEIYGTLVPEPTGFVLGSIALAGLMLSRRRKARQTV